MKHKLIVSLVLVSRWHALELRSHEVSTTASHDNHLLRTMSQYHHAVAGGPCDCRLPILDCRLIDHHKANRQSAIDN